MAILKVARLGQPIVRHVALPVPPEEITSAPIQRFIDDLIETMYEYDGVGLAATQVHVDQQIAVLASHPTPRYPDAADTPLMVIINPHLTPVGDGIEEDWEGCLSVPDLRGQVPRYRQITLEAYDRAGQIKRFTAKDFHARVIQHECDHLMGKVYLDRMTSMESLTFLREFMRYQSSPARSESGNS